MRSEVQVFPGPPDQVYGALAQLVERLLCKQDVVGSIPSGSTSLMPPPRNARVHVEVDLLIPRALVSLELAFGRFLRVPSHREEKTFPAACRGDVAFCSGLRSFACAPDPGDRHQSWTKLDRAFPDLFEQRS